jgi:hypothetical protein
MGQHHLELLSLIEKDSFSPPLPSLVAQIFEFQPLFFKVTIVISFLFWEPSLDHFLSFHPLHLP